MESIQAERRNVGLPKITWTLVNNNWDGHTQSWPLSLQLGIKFCCWNTVSVKINFCCNMSCFSIQLLHFWYPWNVIIILTTVFIHELWKMDSYPFKGAFRLTDPTCEDGHNQGTENQFSLCQHCLELDEAWYSLESIWRYHTTENFDIWPWVAPLHASVLSVAGSWSRFHLDLFIRHVFYWDWSADTQESEITLMISYVSGNHMGKGRIKPTSQ